MADVWHAARISVASGLRKLDRWVQKTVNLDRSLAIVGVAATLILGFFRPTAELGYVVALIGVVAFVGALRARRARLSQLHELPYRIDDSKVTLDIVDADGLVAHLLNHEKVISLQDHLVALRRWYWGDWDRPQLQDMKCFAPAGARVVDCFPHEYGVLFVISLHQAFNYGERFEHVVSLVLRNGFRNENEEYFLWSVSTRIDQLTVVVRLPHDRRVDAAGVRRRVSSAGIFTDEPINEQDISLLPDDRQQISGTWDFPRQGRSYGFIWGWERVSAQ